jgi:predicted TIM-barrel fold metal-dependent hydrolase
MHMTVIYPCMATPCSCLCFPWPPLPQQIQVLEDNKDCSFIIKHYGDRLKESPAERADAFTLARGVAAFAGILIAAQPGRKGDALLAQLATLNDRALSELG